MSSLKRAVRNGLVAGVVAGVVAGLVSRDNGAALTTAIVATGVACAGSYLLGESMDLDEVETQPVEFDG
jgi:ABC-type thiamin/hydroxymethylpyrimidine transport system permease subunit